MHGVGRPEHKEVKLPYVENVLSGCTLNNASSPPSVCVCVEFKQCVSSVMEMVFVIHIILAHE